MCRILILFLLFSFALGLDAKAGPGHDHGPEAASAGTSVHVPKLEGSGSAVELVATADGRTLTIYLDTLDTNEPVDGAAVEVSGEDIEAKPATRVDDGVYALEADWIGKPGTKALTFVITTGETVDLLNGTIEIPPHAAVDTAKGTAWSAILARTEPWVLIGFAVMLGFVLAFALQPIRLPSDENRAAGPAPPPQDNVVRHKKLARILLFALSLGALLSTSALAGPGHDHGDGAHSAAQMGGDIPHKLPDGNVFLPKPSQRLLRIRTAVAAETKTQSAAELVGTVIADPASEGRVQSPMDGKIELADGKAAFVGQLVKAGDLMALLSPTMPVYERGYLEQLAAEVDGKFRIAQQRLRRLQSVSQAYVAQKEIEDTLTEIDALREQKYVLEPKSGQKIELRAPVSGTVSVANVRPGQVVSTGDTLFQIVDPKRIWVEAVGPSGQELGKVDAARAITGAGGVVDLQYVGRSPALREQARPLYFQVSSPPESLAIGEIVKVAVTGGDPVEGFVLPEEAIVRGPNGLPQIWEKVAAERFRPVAVKALPLDGANLLVTDGAKPGMRVVVAGAEFISQVR
jgi:multidrug efflux pump subunit AcrA (membrane-fusion protein)